MVLKQGKNNSDNKLRRWAVLVLCLIAALLSCWYALGMWLDEAAYDSKEARLYDDPAVQRFIVQVRRGHVQAAIALARNIPDGVNITGRDGMTPLLVAVRQVELPMVEALLAAGADPNGAPGNEPLVTAIRVKDLSIARALLKAGADPNGRHDDETPLHLASLMGRLDSVELLLKAGAQVDLANSVGETPALTAALSGQLPMVVYLLDHGASPWATSSIGITIGILLPGKAPSAPDVIQAQQQLIARLQATHYPWPPPTRQEVKALMDEGKWPPKEAQGQ